MLSYRWDSRAVACLSTLLHGKMSECFCRHGCHPPENELLRGQVSPLCRSQFEVHYTDRSPLRRKKKVFFFYLGGISCVSVCVPCPTPSRKSLAPPLALPSVQVSATPGTPPRLPFSRLDSPGSLGGVYARDTRLSPRTAGSARSRPPSWGFNFLIVASSFWRGEESKGERGAPWVGLCVLLV